MIRHADGQFTLKGGNFGRGGGKKKSVIAVKYPFKPSLIRGGTKGKTLFVTLHAITRSWTWD
jgi:hypothetical protein